VSLPPEATSLNERLYLFEPQARDDGLLPTVERCVRRVSDERREGNAGDLHEALPCRQAQMEGRRRHPVVRTLEPICQPPCPRALARDADLELVSE
jgi:hypothetical protein